MGAVVVDGGPVWLYLLARFVEFALVVFFTALWCASMQRALEACDYSSRKMQAGQAWLTFIPLFGFVWQFLAVKNVSESLAQEYEFRGWKSDEAQPGGEIGMVACCAVVVVFLVRVFIPDLNPGLAFISSLAICACMFMHRDRLNAFTERLETENRKSQKNFSFQSAPNPFLQQHFVQPFNMQVSPQTHLQFVQHSLQQYERAQQQMQPVQQPQFVPPSEDMRPPGWDGATVWLPPPGWQHPDLSNPTPYFP